MLITLTEVASYILMKRFPFICLFLFNGLLIYFLLGSHFNLNARPISYPKSWTLMQQYNWERFNLHYHYTTNIRNSLGFVFSDYDEDEAALYATQWNHLLYRKNQKKSQTNFYSKLQLGQLKLKDPSEHFLHFDAHLSYDWETRKYFFATSIGTTYDGPEDAFSMHQSMRIGLAPYLGSYGQLHTWLMLQAEHHPDEYLSDNRIIWTPILRLFKGDFLLELGVNSNQKLLFNSIIRF